MLRNHFGNFYVSDHTDKRTIGWLWMCLKTHFPVGRESVGRDADIGSYGAHDIISKINSALTHISNYEINMQQFSFALDNKFYLWIKDNPEQLSWLENQLIEKYEFPVKDLPRVKFDRRFIISMLDSYKHETGTPSDSAWLGDYTGIAQQTRIEFSTKLHSEWWAAEGDKKVLEWINDSKEPERLKAGWQVFRKQHPELLVDYAGPEDFQEMINLLNKGNVEIPYRELFLDKVKRKHSQNKSKEKTKNKKAQCNVLLSLAAIKRLNNLKDKHEISQAEVIEILLLKEAERNIYIPERIRQTQDDNVITGTKPMPTTVM